MDFTLRSTYSKEKDHHFSEKMEATGVHVLDRASLSVLILAQVDLHL
jgi:hypothetical protein